jgi:hypothetical protein
MSKAIDGLKHCPKCMVTKPVNEFNKNKARSDGYSDYCKDCQRALGRESAKRRRENGKAQIAQAKWREEHPDYHREYMREWQKNPDYLAYRREYMKGDKWKAYVKQWRTDNPDKIKQYQATTDRNRREHFHTKEANRRAQSALALEDKQISTAYRKAIKNDPCFYCGQKTTEMHTDHKLPLAKGGTDHWWNLAKACSHCNLSKGTKCETHFRAQTPCDCLVSPSLSNPRN